MLCQCSHWYILYSCQIPLSIVSYVNVHCLCTSLKKKQHEILYYLPSRIEAKNVRRRCEQILRFKSKTPCALQKPPPAVFFFFLNTGLSIKTRCICNMHIGLCWIGRLEHETTAWQQYPGHILKML